MPSDDRGPSGMTIERVISAWQRARDGLAADEMLASDEMMVSTGTDLDLANVNVDQVLRRLVTAMLFASLRETEAKDLAKAMQARAARYERRNELLRAELLNILLVLERRVFVATEGTVTVKRVAGSVVITDEEALPDDYVNKKIVRTPDRRALHADLVEGVVIAGASLSNGGFSLTFRRQRGAGDDAAVTVED